jgi:glucoamylase
MTALDAWIDVQRGHAIAGLLRAISPQITKTRAQFGQVIIPKKGSVVASPVIASYDPDPDYFFHWYRDSALVMDALRLVQGDVPDARQHFRDFVRFSLDLAKLDGRDSPSGGQAQTDPASARFLRRDIAAAHGDAIPAETRVNPDGTLDITDWPRPQYDGPALRALTVLRWGAETDAENDLLYADLQFVLGHARKPCFDIWEEEVGRHYYTLRLCEAALQEGALWLLVREPVMAAYCRAEAAILAELAEDYWSVADGFIHSRVLEKGFSSKNLDMAVILAANHAAVPPDTRLTATLDRLAALFGARYVINQGVKVGPAMGRYADDAYYFGGAYYFATLGAAEYCYRAGDEAQGNAFLETVRRFAPADGMMAEQFDQNTGAPASARDLAWSHAAFLTCTAARGM